MKQNKNSNMKFVVILTLLAVAILAAVVVFSNKEETLPTDTKKIDITGQPSLGDQDAPVTIVEFGDFKCPACKAWGEMIYPKLVTDYIETGTVQFSFVNVLFHGDESTLGSIAAESVLERSPSIYWDFHHALYDAQPAENHDAEWITPERILEIASDFPEIDQTLLKEDMDQQATMEKVKLDEDLVREVGVAMTPTIVINGKMMEDPFDYEAIKSAIEQAKKDKD
ncbi:MULTISPECIES: DsbA family protein [unclassified Sporosarcina]|uniref:DsbA family protein n=1 Tax=unclassified Sporosarcina TaxID=2647733 RepID=UPI000C16DFA1|nr:MULTISPECIES: DsbA family protein [unclassified Sporosarcina]PID04654.1 dihydroneopterin aldolase [Sporosarcina sp. P30]PID07761.1 dihydroneopterin aldolase [Sporosarcina sp. P31]PID10994.1 dihydroneopterin aldolase [Sporosarcina sp. P32b]